MDLEHFKISWRYRCPRYELSGKVYSEVLTSDLFILLPERRNPSLTPIARVYTVLL